jgi:hypothetical protein
VRAFVKEAEYRKQQSPDAEEKKEEAIEDVRDLVVDWARGQNRAYFERKTKETVSTILTYYDATAIADKASKGRAGVAEELKAAYLRALNPANFTLAEHEYIVEPARDDTSPIVKEAFELLLKEINRKYKDLNATAPVPKGHRIIAVSGQQVGNQISHAVSGRLSKYHYEQLIGGHLGMIDPDVYPLSEFLDDAKKYDPDFDNTSINEYANEYLDMVDPAKLNNNP